MIRILIAVAITVMLLDAGCKPRPESESHSRKPAPESAHAPRAAVLFFEEIADRAPGGLSVHANQIEGLAAALRARAIPTEVHLVPADDPAPVLPASYDAVIAIDVPSIRASEAAMLEAFVREGGVALFIGSHAGSDSLLGVRTSGDDPVPREGLSRVIRGGHPWTLARGATVDWGPLSSVRWPIKPEAAVVRIADADDEPILTVHNLGDGAIWYCAVLPPGRAFDGWKSAPDAVDVLAGIVRSAPRRGRESAPPPLRVDLAVNSVAYGESPWPVRAIARVRGGAGDDALEGTFEVLDSTGNVVLKGELERMPPRWRSRFLAADLSQLPAGEFRVEVRVPPANPVAAAIRRSNSQLDSVIGETLAKWLDGLDHTPPTDSAPVTAREIEDRALLVWALARALEISGTPERYRYDVERLAYWFRAAGPRLLSDPAATAPTLGIMAAGLARAVEPIRREASAHLSREIQILAERAYASPAARRGDDLSSVGARLWAAVELHRATWIADYRADADAAARLLFARQLDRGHAVEGDVYGDFFLDARRTLLPPSDGSRARNIGFLLGLVALENIAEPGTFKVDLGVILDRFARGFLLGGAKLNPYGAFPAGLEPAEPPKPRPDGRGMASPDKVRARAYAREVPDAIPGVEAARLALAIVAMERHLTTGEPDLRRAAMDQINHLLGLNPEGKLLLRDGMVLNGVIGRGPEQVPVWRAAFSEKGEDLPAHAWLLALHALLFDRRP